MQKLLFSALCVSGFISALAASTLSAHAFDIIHITNNTTVLAASSCRRHGVRGQPVRRVAACLLSAFCLAV